MNLENAKENIQPLPGGRHIRTLEVALNAEKDQDAQEELHNQKKLYEDAIHNYAGTDLLDPWFEYISWLEQSYPRSGKDSALDELIRKCLTQFEPEERYRQDRRLIKLYIRYIDSQQEPQEYYQELYNHGIGTMCADLYIAWAYYYDAADNFTKADEIYRKGLDARAQPFDELELAHKNFGFTMSQRILHRDESSQQKFMSSLEERRNALTSLRAHKNRHVGTLRTGNAVRSSRPGRVAQENRENDSGNRGAIKVFEDVSRHEPAHDVDPASTSVIRSIVDSARKQENLREPGPWSKAKHSPSKNRNLYEKPTSAAPFCILEDSNPEVLSALPVCTTDLTIRLPKNFVAKNQPQKPWKVATALDPDKVSASVIPMYWKHHLYTQTAAPDCFSPEELRGYYWLKRQRPNAGPHPLDKFWANGFAHGCRLESRFIRKNTKQDEWLVADFKPDPPQSLTSPLEKVMAAVERHHPSEHDECCFEELTRVRWQLGEMQSQRARLTDRTHLVALQMDETQMVGQAAELSDDETATASSVYTSAGSAANIGRKSMGAIRKSVVIRTPRTEAEQKSDGEKPAHVSRTSVAGGARKSILIRRDSVAVATKPEDNDIVTQPAPPKKSILTKFEEDKVRAEPKITTTAAHQEFAVFEDSVAPSTSGLFSRNSEVVDKKLFATAPEPKNQFRRESAAVATKPEDNDIFKQPALSKKSILTKFEEDKIRTEPKITTPAAHQEFAVFEDSVAPSTSGLFSRNSEVVDKKPFATAPEPKNQFAVFEDDSKLAEVSTGRLPELRTKPMFAVFEDSAFSTHSPPRSSAFEENKTKKSAGSQQAFAIFEESVSQSQPAAESRLKPSIFCDDQGEEAATAMPATVLPNVMGPPSQIFVPRKSTLSRKPAKVDSVICPPEHAKAPIAVFNDSNVAKDAMVANFKNFKIFNDTDSSRSPPGRPAADELFAKPNPPAPRRQAFTVLDEDAAEAPAAIADVPSPEFGLFEPNDSCSTQTFNFFIKEQSVSTPKAPHRVNAPRVDHDEYSPPDMYAAHMPTIIPPNHFAETSASSNTGSLMIGAVPKQLSIIMETTEPYTNSTASTKSTVDTQVGSSSETEPASAAAAPTPPQKITADPEIECTPLLTALDSDATVPSMCQLKCFADQTDTNVSKFVLPLPDKHRVSEDFYDLFVKSPELKSKCKLADNFKIADDTSPVVPKMLAPPNCCTARMTPGYGTNYGQTRIANDSFTFPSMSEFYKSSRLPIATPIKILPQPEATVADLVAPKMFAPPNCSTAKMTPGYGAGQTCIANDSFTFPSMSELCKSSKLPIATPIKVLAQPESSTPVNSTNLMAFPLSIRQDLAAVPDVSCILLNESASPAKSSDTSAAQPVEVESDEELTFGRSIYEHISNNGFDEELADAVIWDEPAKKDTNEYRFSPVNFNRTDVFITNFLQSSRTVDPFDPHLLKAFLIRTDFQKYVSNLRTCTMVNHVDKLRKGSHFTIVNNRYEVIKLIGEGTFGQIYSAKCFSTGKTVALKQERPANLWEYYICLELISRLKNRDILKGIMEIDAALIGKNASIFVNEYSPYGSLIAVCNNVKRATDKNIDEFIVMMIASQILSIIDHLHACNIIHADIKPDNFLLMRPIAYGSTIPSVKLIDFGVAIDLAHFPDGQTFNYRITTEGFTCVEMLEGRPWTFQTDLYCTAATIHVLLLGRYMEIEKKPLKWNIRNKLPRYFVQSTWDDIFTTLINIPDCSLMPNLQRLRQMLEENIAMKETYLQRKLAQFNSVI